MVIIRIIIVLIIITVIIIMIMGIRNKKIQHSYVGIMLKIDSVTHS